MRLCLRELAASSLREVDAATSGSGTSLRTQTGCRSIVGLEHGNLEASWSWESVTDPVAVCNPPLDPSAIVDGLEVRGES